MADSKVKSAGVKTAEKKVASVPAVKAESTAAVKAKGEVKP